MKRHHPLPALLLALSLCGPAQSLFAQAISFTPTSGVAQPGQSVTVTATGNWTTPPTIFCTTDGSPANIAATLVGSIGSGGGSIPVLQGVNQTSQTLNCVAAVAASAYQNVNTSETGWKTCIGNLAYATNGTPTATCTGGVGTSYPTSWNFTWGPTMTQEMTGGDNVQILAGFLANECALCDQPSGTQIMIAQSKTVMATVDSTILSNNEMDMESVDAANTINGIPIEHNFGLQCEQSAPATNPGFWAIDGVGKWIPTTITDHCPWPANTPINLVAQGWWQLGDTGCGGNGCFNVLSITVNGTVYDLSSTVWVSGYPAGTLAQPGQPGWSSFFGLQDQMDLAVAGGTAGRTVTNANVTVASYSPNPVTASATYSTPATATLLSPSVGSVLTGSSETFTWSPAAGATGYALWLGSTGVGTHDLYYGGIHTATTLTVNNLPINGETVYATLYTVFNGTLQSMNYTFIATAQSTMSTPAPSTTLPGPSATFNWSPSVGATGYALWVGTTGVGSNDLFYGGIHNATSVTVNKLPANGESIYVRLYTFYSGTQASIDYVYSAATQAAIATPAQGSAFTSPSATFTWSSGAGATGYALWLGTAGIGSHDLLEGGIHPSTSLTFNTLPIAGQTIYARLYTSFNGTLVSSDSTYTAAQQAAIVTPAPTTAFVGSSVTFNWSAGTGGTSFALWLGTTGVGSHDLLYGGLHTATSLTVNNLPTNSETIYARLYTSFNGVLESTDYTYTAAAQ